MLLFSLAVCAFLVSWGPLLAADTDFAFVVRVIMWYLVSVLVVVASLAVYLGYTSNVDLYQSCCSRCDGRVFRFYEDLAVKHQKKTNALKREQELSPVVEIYKEQGLTQEAGTSTHAVQTSHTEQEQEAFVD